MNSSQSTSMQISPREQKNVYNEIRDKSLVQMHQELNLKLERLMNNLGDYFRGESEIL